MSVHFNAVTERFSPCDTIFPIATSKELKDSTLSAACSLHTASGSSSSSTSSLRQRRLMEIAEDAEEDNKKKNQSVLQEDLNPAVFTQTDADSLAETQTPDATTTPRVSTATEGETFAPHSSLTHASEKRSVSPSRTLHGRRQSSQSARPDFYSYNSYGSSGKPKVKLGPRPSLDNSGRSASTSGTHRPVSTLPAGLKLVSKDLKKSDERPHTQYSRETPIMPSSPPPLQNSTMPPNNTATTRPHTSGGHSNSSSAASIPHGSFVNKVTPKSTITPEKARLLKALEMRKKQMNSPAAKEPSPISSEEDTKSPSETGAQTTDTVTGEIKDDPTMLNGDTKGYPAVAAELSSILTESESDISHVMSTPESPLETSETPQSTQASSISDSTDETVQPESDRKIEQDTEQLVGEGDCDDLEYVGIQGTGDSVNVDDCSRKYTPIPLDTLLEERKPMERAEQIEEVPVMLVQSESSLEVAMATRELEGTRHTWETSLAERQDIALTALSSPGPETESLVRESGSESLVLHSHDDATNIQLIAPNSAVFASESFTQRFPENELQAPHPKGQDQMDTTTKDPQPASPASREMKIPRSKFSMQDLNVDKMPKSKLTVQDLKIHTPSKTDDIVSVKALETPAAEAVVPPIEPASPSESNFTAHTNTTSTKKHLDSGHGLESWRKRGTHIDPIRTDFRVTDRSGNDSDNELLSDDELLDELQSATVQEAQPISVSKSPMNSVFPSPTNGGRENQFQRAFSNPTSKNDINGHLLSLPHDSQTPSSRSASASSAYLSRINQQHPPKPLVTKVNIGSSISKRIKALEQSAGPVTPGVPGASPGPSTLFPRNPSVRGTTASPSIQERASSLTRNTPSPSGDLQDASKIRDGSGSGNSPLHSIKFTAVEPLPLPRPESISVTARIVRDPNQLPPQKPQNNRNTSDYGRLDLKQSPLMIDHQAAIPAQPKDVTKEEQASKDAKKERRSSMNVVKEFISEGRTSFSENRRKSLVIDRPSLSSRPPSTHQNAPTLARPSSTGSRHSISSRENSSISGRPTLSPKSSDEASEAKSGSRATRMLRRMSSGLLASRKQIAHALSPTVREETEPVASDAPSPNTNSQAAIVPSTAVEIGDVNVQFPDTLLWKRRCLKLDTQGNLILSQAQGSKGTEKSAVTKRFHLSEFRLPFVPDMELEEMPNSVVLDFVEGGGLQIACQDRGGQLSVLKSKLQNFMPILVVHTNFEISTSRCASLMGWPIMMNRYELNQHTGRCCNNLHTLIFKIFSTSVCIHIFMFSYVLKKICPNHGRSVLDLVRSFSFV